MIDPTGKKVTFFWLDSCFDMRIWLTLLSSQKLRGTHPGIFYILKSFLRRLMIVEWSTMNCSADILAVKFSSSSTAIWSTWLSKSDDLFLLHHLSMCRQIWNDWTIFEPDFYRSFLHQRVRWAYEMTVLFRNDKWYDEYKSCYWHAFLLTKYQVGALLSSVFLIILFMKVDFFFHCFL